MVISVHKITSRIVNWVIDCIKSNTTGIILNTKDIMRFLVFSSAKNTSKDISIVTNSAVKINMNGTKVATKGNCSGLENIKNNAIEIHNNTNIIIFFCRYFIFLIIQVKHKQIKSWTTNPL